MTFAAYSLLGLRRNEIAPGVLRRALFGPVDEFLGRPGKEFRSRLVAAGWTLAGGPGRVPPPLAHFVEHMHAGSLIVDDIEDGALERRGARALHRRHGVPIALNAGNFLYFWPLARLRALGLPPRRELAIHRHYAETMVRCHVGQALDLAVRVWDLPQRDVVRSVAAATRLKTGSLTEFAMLLGATAAGADEKARRLLGRLGRDLGTALQMFDDLSGIANPRRRHKGREDLGLGRLTWPWAWAAEWSTATAYARLRDHGHRVGRGSLPPEALSKDFRAILRGRARERARAKVAQAFERAAPGFGRLRAFARLKSDVDGLGRSFGCDE
jgi:geranylgeranyl pyrophosphate synthase